jgi:hypothetical protein
MNTVTMSEGQLVKTIRTHLAKAETLQGKANDHFVAAGIHIKTLKAQHDGAGGTWAQWEEKLRTQLNLGKSRASELMQIADGTKTIEGIRGAEAEKHRQLRAKSSPVRTRETADDDRPADHQSPWAAHGQPAPDDDDGDSPEVMWRRGLIYRATESAARAAYEDWSQFTADSEVVAAAERAAEAWEKTAAYLRELGGGVANAVAAKQFETTPEDAQEIEPKRRGRPPGSKNKAKAIAAMFDELVERVIGATDPTIPVATDPFEIPPMLDRTRSAS